MPFDSNPDFARLLGFILERWTMLESSLAKALSCLLNDNYEAARAIIYSLNSTSTRIALVRAVARELVPEGPELRGFVYLLDKINDLQKRRNELIHGEYWHGMKDGALDLVLIRPMNADPFKIHLVNLDQLQEHIEKVEEREFQLGLAIDPDPRYHFHNTYWQRRNEQLQKKWFHDVATAKRHGEPEPQRPPLRR